MPGSSRLACPYATIAPSVVSHDPGVSAQIEVRPAPHLPHERGVERRLHAVRTLVGEEHVADRIGVVAGRRPERVALG